MRTLAALLLVAILGCQTPKFSIDPKVGNGELDTGLTLQLCWDRTSVIFEYADMILGGVLGATEFATCPLQTEGTST